MAREHLIPRGTTNLQMVNRGNAQAALFQIGAWWVSEYCIQICSQTAPDAHHPTSTMRNRDTGTALNYGGKLQRHARPGRPCKDGSHSHRSFCKGSGIVFHRSDKRVQRPRNRARNDAGAPGGCLTQATTIECLFSNKYLMVGNKFNHQPHSKEHITYTQLHAPVLKWKLRRSRPSLPPLDTNKLRTVQRSRADRCCACGQCNVNVAEAPLNFHF